MAKPEYDDLPDIRDGLSRKERIVLYCLRDAQNERGSRHISTALLYGRVLEYVDMTEGELQRILQRLSASGGQTTTSPNVPSDSK